MKVREIIFQWGETSEVSWRFTTTFPWEISVGGGEATSFSEVQAREWESRLYLDKRDALRDKEAGWREKTALVTIVQMK